MQVSACMKTEPSSPQVTATHERLLAAAATVFAREGIAGATTRAIAREAGVNEVTLFRHFGSKERLLAAVVGKNFDTEAHAPAAAADAADTNLRTDLEAYARSYHRKLTENIALIRTMIGEIQHHRANFERQVFKGTMRPLREALEARLQAAVDRGELRADSNLAILADLFGAMIFTEVLRRTAPSLKIDYTDTSYLATAVDVFLHGAAVPV